MCNYQEENDWVAKDHLRAMLHVEGLLDSTWHYDAAIARWQKGREIFPRGRWKSQPRPYMSHEWSVENLNKVSS